MKIFYKLELSRWSKLAEAMNYEIAEVYEIRTWDEMVRRNEAEGCQVIRLWDEELQGTKYSASLMVGQSDITLFDLLVEDYNPYLYKIENALGDEKEVVLAIENDVFSKQLVEYFLGLKKSRGLRIHVWFNFNGKKPEETRYYLRYLDHLEELDSVVVFSYDTLYDSKEVSRWDICKRGEIIQICEEIIAEEASKFLEKLPLLQKTKRHELWFAVMPEQEYRLIEL